MKHFITSLPKIFFNCFSKKNLFWHAIAIVSTYILVITNFDWFYFTQTRIDTLDSSFFPAVIIGGLMPFILPIVLLTIGYIKKLKDCINAGYLLGQAAILGSIISSLYKALTGRLQPDLHNIVINIGNKFNFGFLKHGIFWGWPSSHTTIAFAMAVTLIYLYPKNKLLKLLSIIYAFYIGIGVSLSIHWFSDFIAGAIIGTVIGITVVKNYRKN